MANYYNFLSLDDLKDVLDEASLLLLQETNYSQQPILTKIKQLCLLFEQQYHQINKNDDAEKKMYTFGMKIVFSLREFLLQEEIIYSIGATSPDGKKLSVKEISQKEVFTNITANLKSKQMELSAALEKYNPEQLSSLSELWGKVVEAADFNWEDGYSQQKNYLTSKGKTRRVYKKPNPDTNVWVRYYMRQKKRYLTYYYDKGNFDLVAYNSGWLYEWFQEYVSDHENQLQLEAAFLKSNTPLKQMMFGATRENIEGYKGGDYIDAYGRQVQAKKGNKRIITFTAIRNVIIGGQRVTGILPIIQRYEAELNNPESARKMGEKFAALFTDNRTVINKEYDLIVDNILKQLKS